MLVLTRKPKEAVELTMPDGTKCRVIVTEIQPGKVRLGFDCPKSIKIMRTELLDDNKESH